MWSGYLGQCLLDKLVKNPVLLPDVMSHHRLPVGVVLPIAACHGTDVPGKEQFRNMATFSRNNVLCLRFLCWQIGSYSVLEVHPCQMVLQVAVRVLCGCLEFANGANLDRILSRVPRDAQHRPVQGLTKGSQARRFPVDVRRPVPVLVPGFWLPNLAGWS